MTGTQQLASDLERGGDSRWGSVTLGASATRQFAPAFRAGLAVRFEDQDWRIHTATAFGALVPWSHLQRGSVLFPTRVALARALVVGLAPTVEWAYESGAKSADTFIYGAIVSATAVLSPRMTLGAGASVTRQFYSVRVYPFALVSWQLTDHVRIANASPFGPEGGAGVELCWAPGEGWELAAGGVYRSDRWRLKPQPPYADDVAETSGIPLLGRLSRRLDQKSVIDLYAGAATAGRLRIRNPSGDQLIAEREDVSLSVAFTLRRVF